MDSRDGKACIQGVDLLGCGRVARRLRPVGLVVSMVLHLAVVAGGLWLAAVVPHRELPEGVYEVEIVRPEMLAPLPAAEPAREALPSAAQPPAREAVARAEQMRPKTRPAAEPEPQPRPAAAPALSAPAESLEVVAPARGPAAAEPGPAEAGGSAAAPGPADALDIAAREAARTAAAPPPAGDSGPVVGVVQREGRTDVGGLHGFAAFADTFGLDRLARESFTDKEYAGFYRVQGEPGRFLVLVDATAAGGRLLLFDPKTGFLRGLKKHNDMVYSYGFAGGGDEPVDGVVYLLPKKERYARDLLNLPHQIVWMPDPPPAVVGEMVRLREEDLAVESGGRRLAGRLFAPRGAGPFPGVVWLPGGCESLALRDGFARGLAVRGLAVLVFDYPGCAEAEGVVSRLSLDGLAGDVQAALRVLRGAEGVAPGRAGLWARDQGVLVALRAAARSVPGQGPDFMVLAARAGGGEEPFAPPEADIRAAAAPQFWLLAGPRPAAAWRRHLRLLDGLGAQGRPVAATLYAEDPPAEGDAAARLAREVTPWHAALGVGWIMERK